MSSSFVDAIRSSETQIQSKIKLFPNFLRDQFNTIKEIRNEIQQIKEKDERKTNKERPYLEKKTSKNKIGKTKLRNYITFC